LPDFLDDHNTGDLVGWFSSYGSMARNETRPLTRYCVELLDVTLPGIQTASTTGQLLEAPFADFGSCMWGTCQCMALADRMIARQTEAQIRGMCDPIDDLGQCQCTKKGMELTHNYTGRSVIPVPLRMSMGDGDLPQGYPFPYVTPVRGHWFSHPGGGRCPLGAAPGDGGCTWQRAALSHSVYTADLLAAGLNNTFHQTGRGMAVDEATAFHNVEVGRRVLDSMNLPPCGAPSPADGMGPADVVIV